ncbi:hypothetical protein MHPYR_590005 [uncultured Mycobacterium sp.]|uniref:Uncharacterized protein n=1 Tax=uncultured Mycobacterium sp. TaxID=171292 RepID=A0A1Y5PRC2_9MYCO|nr:hypothetical protein MHPYR_590005 [uncultured Mycobacterium sp.]
MKGQVAGGEPPPEPLAPPSRGTADSVNKPVCLANYSQDQLNVRCPLSN